MFSSTKCLCSIAIVIFFAACVGDINDKQEKNWRPDVRILLECPWISSSNLDRGGGPASLVMAAAYIYGYRPIQNDISDLITWMMSENKGGGGFYNSSGDNMTLFQLSKVARQYYNLTPRIFQNYPVEGVPFEEIYEGLIRGSPVLVRIMCQTDNLVNQANEGCWHYMLIVGMTPTHVVVNDPGFIDGNLGYNRLYAFESFLGQWSETGSGILFLSE